MSDVPKTQRYEGVYRIQRVLLAYAATLAMVVLWFGPYVANSLRDDSRYFFLWDQIDSVTLLACMMLMAGVWLVVGWLVHRWAPPAWGRLFDHLFVVGFGAGVLNNVAFHCTRPRGYSISQFGMEVQTGWIALILITAYAYGSRTDRLVRYSRQLCLILSPAVLILAYQLVMRPVYPATLDPLGFQADQNRSADDSEGSASDGGPVFLFVFDEWSYERTFPSGRVRHDMPHLRALAEECLIFHDAHSPGPRTKLSMPRLLFQTEAPVVAGERRLGFVGEGGFVPGSQHPTVFDAVGTRDYYMAVAGFLLPYRQWLGDQVDLCRAYPYYPRGDSMLTRAGMHFFKAAEKSTDPWLSFGYRRLNEGVQFRFFADLQHRLADDIESILADSPVNTFGVFHYPLPHKPFLFASDGSYREDPHGIFDNTSANYENNLRQLDRVIGRFVSTLRQAGKYDDTLIIMTSDHTWRHDPAKARSLTDNELTHVPLIVKLPGAMRVGDRREAMHTARLAPLIAAGLDGQEAVAAFLESRDEAGGRVHLTRAEGAVRP